MLLSKGKITEDMVRMPSGWRHSGFNVFCGNRISPNVDTAMENLARYIIRASFSQERMRYLDQEGTVVYRSKDNKKTKTFPALPELGKAHSEDLRGCPPYPPNMPGRHADHQLYRGPVLYPHHPRDDYIQV